MIVLLGLASAASAAERIESADMDKDGKKETQFVYEGSKIVRELLDKNDDGKPDTTIQYQNGKRHHGEGASKFDGKIDTWYLYGVTGALRQIIKDSNGDNKPDEFFALLKGRNVMLREYDKNYDGRIDKRQLVEWSPNRLNIPGQAPIPGYVPLWTEEDKDFDGKIDAYREKGNKEAAAAKIGKPIASQPAPLPDETQPAQPKDNTGAAEKRMQRLNEQHGLNP